MNVDSETLVDLELLTATHEAGALFATFDHTQTTEGARQLRSMFMAPLGTASAIRLRQDLLRSILAHGEMLQSRDLEALIRRVTSYTNSSFVPLPEHPISRWVVRRQYADVATNLVEGLSATVELLEEARRLGDILEEFPLELAEAHAIARDIRECVDADTFRKLGAVATRGRSHTRSFGRFDAGVGRTRELHLLRQCISSLGLLDALLSLARASNQDGFTFPGVIDATTPLLLCDGAFHPLLKGAVRNNVAIQGKTRIVFLTGPNMAGKTTFMKTCAIIILLTHMGMAVPAASASVAVCDRLLTALSVRDSVARGESFFLAEVRRIGVLVRYIEEGQRVVAFVDEMFKGTNVLDASAATAVVIEGLVHAKTSLTVVASHLTELTEQFSERKPIMLLCFEAEINRGVVTFSYRLQPGTSSQRLGLFLLEQEGVLKALRVIELHGRETFNHA